MSISSFGNSDLHIVDDGQSLACCGWMLHPDRKTFEGNHKEMLEHVGKHIAAGHKVQSSTIERLMLEIKIGKTIFSKPLIEDLNSWDGENWR